ncbi:MAG TPA: tRNA (adenosine(37)-N6)-threonylcarbamoyltransferase complex dimerization subunit type 1 TsaB [Chthoniobacterales bacterium]
MLALELSSPVGSVAFVDDEGPRDFRAFPADRKDSGFFYENLRRIYEKGAKPDMIAVGLGPGSYAGVRIAISTALGLAAASGARLRGVPSICAIDRPEYFFIGDARRNSLFFARIEQGHCLEGPGLTTAEELHEMLNAARETPVIATQPLPSFPQVVVENPSALRLLEVALRSDEEGDVLEPIYLREPYITTPRK